MTPAKKKVRLSDTVANELETLITSMKPGDRLPTENELMERFSVGRSTIRECMKVFTARKMIVRRNEGTFVADAVKDCLVDPLNLIINMEIGNVRALMELREIIELATIRMAAERATKADVVELERARWMMTEPGLARTDRQQRDIDFHSAIARTTGNFVLVELLNALRTVIANNVEVRAGKLNWMDGPRDFHKEMVDAIAAKDPDAAYKCMKDYFDSIHQSIGI